MTLNDSNYFSAESNKAYMSNSQFGNWLKCAAKEYAIQNGQYEQAAQTWGVGGNYAHTALLQPDKLPQFEHDNEADLFTLKYPTHQDLKDLALTHGVDLKGAGKPKQATADRLSAYGVPIPPPTRNLSSDFTWIGATVEAFKRQQVFMDALNFGRKEQIIVFDLGGVPWKARIDNDRSHGHKEFDDLKFMKDFSDGWSDHYGARVPWYSVYQYERQMAVYRFAIHQSTGVWCTPNIHAASKQPVPDVTWVRFDNEAMLNNQVDEVRRAMPLVTMWKNGSEPAPRCEVCDYCRSTKVIEFPESAHLGQDII